MDYQDIFCCDEIRKTPSNVTIIEMAEQKLKQFNHTDFSDIPEEFEILGQKMSFNELTLPEDVIHYFCLVKKTVNMFRAGITAKRSASDRSLWTSYRQQIFNFLKIIARKMNGKIEEKFEQIIIKEVINLTTFMGRLSMLEDFDPNIYIIQAESQSPSRQYLHICLDIWLISYQILCEYNKRTRVKIDLLSDINISDDFRSKFLECILADLIYASLQRFTSTKDLRMVVTLDPFFCPCHRIFYTMIKILIEKDSPILNIHPFWFHYNSVMETFCDENRKENAERDSLTTYKRIPSNFSSAANLNIANLWLMSNLMELVNPFKESSTDQDVCNSVGFTHAIVPILQEYEASGFFLNDPMEISLQLCYNSVRKCGTCVDLPAEFIRCYLKSLTSPDVSNSIFYSLPKTSNQWSLKLRVLFERGTASDWDDRILGLLILLLEKVISKLSIDTNNIRNLQMWKKLINDLFSAVSNCPVDQMNENQLHKVFTILIVCCYASDRFYTDFIDRFREIALLIINRSVYSQRTKLVIQWIICLAQMLSDDADMKKILSIAFEVFDKLAEVYSKLDKTNRSARESCSEIILLYFDEIIYLSEVKVDTIGRCPLIPQTICKVFAQLVDRDLFAVVQSISNTIRIVRNYIPTVLTAPNRHSYGPFIANVLKDFMGFVKNQYSKGAINQMNLSQVAANLTYFSYIKDPGRLNSSEFRYNFFQFTCHPKVDLIQREKFCDFLFQNNDPLIVKEISDFLPELMERYLKSDESGQSRIATVLNKMIIFINNNGTNHVEELFFTKLSEMINRILNVATITKLLRLLEIFIKVLPEIKEKAIRKVAQRIHEMEMEGNKSTGEIKEALRKFFHNQQNNLSSSRPAK